MFTGFCGKTVMVAGETGPVFGVHSIYEMLRVDSHLGHPTNHSSSNITLRAVTRP